MFDILSTPYGPPRRSRFLTGVWCRCLRTSSGARTDEPAPFAVLCKTDLRTLADDTELIIHDCNRAWFFPCVSHPCFAHRWEDGGPRSWKKAQGFNFGGERLAEWKLCRCESRRLSERLIGTQRWCRNKSVEGVCREQVDLLLVPLGTMS